MRNFRRALKDALKQWPYLGAASACSFMIALLWSGNIMAFYPILQVVLDDKPIQQWVDEQIEATSGAAATHTARAEQLRAELAASGISDQRAQQASKELRAAERAAAEQESAASWYRKLEPWVDRWVPRTPFRTVVAIVGLLMITTVVKHVFMVANELLVAKVAIDVTRSLRSRLFSTALYMDRASYSQHGISGFSAHITNTSEGLTAGLVSFLGAAIREPLKVVTCLVGAALINWRLLLVSVLVAPFVGYMLVWITRRLKSISRGVLAQTTAFHEVMLESLHNMQTVQAYGMEPAESGRFDDAIRTMRAIGLRLTFFTALSKPVIEFLGLGMLCTTIVCGAYLVLQQKTAIFGIPVASEPMSVHALLTFFGLLIGTSDPLRKLSSIYSNIYVGGIAADAIYGLLDQKNRIVDPVEPKSVAHPHKLLKLDNIVFGYRPDHTVLQGVSLEIPFGSTVAIVGSNGSGKSTMISLLCRFYDPQGGDVTLDGVGLREMRVSDVRQRIALVTQQTELFNSTIMYNILYGSPSATEADAMAAAQAAQAHEFIEQLPDGYRTMVGQGGHRLSGGQRQRIALARALLRDPEILILDECTSQIDMHSERLIRSSLRKHRGRRTMIIITHREALLELADRVYEVDCGQLRPADLEKLAAAA